MSDRFKLGRNRYSSGKFEGFGFIEMPNQKKAIKDLDGKNVLTRNLKVNVTKPKNDRF
ncbi:RNA-binding protein [Leptospira interrogans]|nr:MULTISPECIES: RNA-binding protein [Leptospira]MCL8311692.1 RNA-binding protein [Leptospira interrogans]